MVRVLMATEAFGGGVYTWLAMVCPELRRRGLDVSVAFRRRDDIPTEEVVRRDFQGCRLTDLDQLYPARGAVELARSLKRVLSAEQPEVLHLHSSWAGLAGRAVLALSPVHRRPPAVFYSPHCFAFLRQDLTPLVRAVVRAAEAVMARSGVAATLACGPAESSLARKMSGITRDVCNGVSIPAGLAGSPPCWESAPGGALIVSAGRMVPQKDPLFALEVAVGVLERDPDARFFWIGSGPLEAQVHTRLSLISPQVRERISVLPWMSRADYLKTLASATVYLHTARWEGLSLAILEAMLYGLPIVVRRAIGCHEVVSEENCGLVAETSAAACANLIALLGDVSQRRALGERGQAAVRRLYNLDRMVQDLVDLYSEAVPRASLNDGR